MRAISGTFTVRVLTCLLLGAITACSANGSAPGGADDDDDTGGEGEGEGDLPPVNEGADAKITVITTTTPSLIAFRDGTGAAWQTPTPASPGRYDFVVHGPYTVAVVCATSDFTETTEIARTPDEPREVAMPCRAPITSQPRVHVTGTMAQAAQLALGTAQSVTIGDDLQFDLAVEPGTYDLVVKTIAPQGQDEIVIRRDQVVTGSARLAPAIDPAREKVALVDVPVTVSNLLPDDNAVIAARLTTSTTASALASGRTASSVRVLANSVLRSTDVQSVRVTANLLITDQFYFVRFRTVEHLLARGAVPELALPPELDSLEFTVVDDQLRMTWGALPDHDTIDLAISVKPNLAHRKVLSADYVKTTGVTGATLDTRLPGYEPAWKIDIAGPHQRKVTTQQTQTDGTGAISMIDQDINMPPGQGRSAPVQRP
jgi:hypothetical protein